MRIYLADLGHNQLTISSDVYPLGVADLATYAKAYVATREPLEITIYREPQDLKAAIDAEAPAILGLSSYSWNFNLSRTFARYAKARDARTVTVMGGPNYPLTEGDQEAMLRDLVEIDVAVRGPTYEGERALVNFLQRYIACDGSLDEIQAETLAGSHWIHRKTGRFERGPEVPRINDLDEIPSPYLAGLLDPYFSTGYLPMMQITRGCPFTCAFCNSSVRSNSKAFSHSLENVKADLLYIAQRVHREVAITFADDNFGMYALDVEVADYIAYLQEKFGWPTYVRTTTGKNRGDRIIQVMRKIRGALPMTAAVQSMDPTVLKNIERTNIKLDTYAEIQREVRAQGMQAYGELILCLPGETKASFLKGIRDLMGTGVQRVSAHQLMLLPGAPLHDPESRERFGLKTRFRIVARNVGDYTGDRVIETEEMVCETPTMSFQDYLDLRVFHLLLTTYYYEGNYEEAFEFAKSRGLAPFDLVARMQEMLGEAPAEFREVIDGFVRESQDELFPTREACVAWAREHFDGLVTGALGGNLLSKYSMLGRFYVTSASLAFLEQAIASALERGGLEHSAEELSAVINYLRCVSLHVPFAETIATTPTWTSRYDVEAWAADRFARPLASHTFDRARTFDTHVEPKRKAQLLQRLATYGEHPAGLGKFTRTVFARDLRRSLEFGSSVRAALQPVDERPD
ncbi:MAG: radical SAM protein [Elusimicrobia bacterium]|nr:radical SAM protein [Elusimicrobiota bacterium]